MARTNTQGWYYFADGTYAWFYGLSAQEKKNEIRKHGAVIKFVPTHSAIVKFAPTHAR